MYDRLAQFYDWEHSSFKDDLQFYLAVAGATGDPILEAACGSGRVLLPLAEAGHRVAGVDSSETMLGMARDRVAAAGLADRVRLAQGDMRTMELGEQFPMALVALGSFHHLLTMEDQRACLRRLASHLAPGGTLLLDLMNPTPDWIASGGGSLVLQLSGPFPGPEGPDRVTKFAASSSYFDVQEDRTHVIYDRVKPDGSLTRYSFDLVMRFLFHYEAELLLQEAGFRIRETYGGYDMEAYASSSPRMIFVAEKI